MPDHPTPTVPDVNRWLVAVSVVFSTFMEVLDTTVVNVSLPHLAGNLSATIEEATWVLTSYLVANAIVLPMTGWLARHFGRKRLLMLAITGFTVSSFLCGLAPNLASLIVFRVFQGLSGGAMQPLSQAIMLEAFPPEDRGKAMAVWAVCIVTAPIVGPVLGGWLTDSYSWRWVFYINIPVGIVSISMARAFVFDPAYLRRPTTGIDYWGISMLAVGMGALQIFLDKGEQEDWFSSDAIVALAVIAGCTLTAFVVYELKVANPVVNLKVFTNRTYATGVAMMTAVGFALYSSVVLLPIMLQTLMGYPALQAGIAMAPRGLGSLLFTPVIGLMLGRVGARKVLAAGLTVFSVTMFWLGNLTLDAGYWNIFWPQFIQGMSMACLFVPLTTITMDPIPREEMGNATSIFNVMRNIGGSIGIATTTTLMSRGRQAYTNVMVRHVNPYSLATRMTLDGIRSAMMGRGSDFQTASRRSLAVIWYMVQRQAAMRSIIDIFRLLALVFLVMLPFVWLAKSPRLRKGGGAARGR